MALDFPSNLPVKGKKNFFCGMFLDTIAAKNHKFLNKLIL